MRVLRAPALHFLVLGACLFALTRAGARAPEPLELDAARVAGLRADWAAETGAPPDERETAALVGAAVDEELLLREARARGFVETDPVVRARLARNARFLGEGAPGAGDAELAETARALGLERGDLVVRRRLVERMRAELEAEAVPPSDAEIEARFASDPARFRAPERVRIAHVFFARTRAGDASALALRLKGDRIAPEAAFGLGDPFLPGHELAPRSERELARDFGADFARGVFALPVGAWSGPVDSSFGAHVVYVRERTSGAPQGLAAARPQIEAELREEHARAALHAGLARLRARQPIRVAGRAP